eukprot:SAG31_NODE_793_length_12044_cov_12.886229_7_plen_112_part_00
MRRHSHCPVLRFSKQSRVQSFADVKKVSEMKANILGAFLARGSKGSRRKEQTKEKVDSSHSMDEKDRFANNRKSEKKKLKEVCLLAALHFIFRRCTSTVPTWLQLTINCAR